MKQNAAMLLTVATAFSCGFPGVAMMCLGNLSLINTQYPGQPTPDALSALFQTAVYLAIGLALFVIPVITGIISFSLTQNNEKAELGGGK